MSLRIAIVAISCAIPIACSVVSEMAKDAKSSDVRVKNFACPVKFEPGRPKLGQTVTVLASSSDVWKVYQSIDLGDLSLSADKPSGTLEVNGSRSYGIVLTRNDGILESCSSDVHVESSRFVGCSLSVSPTTLQDSGETKVNVTLQVVGSEEIGRVSIDNQNLPSNVGGSLFVNRSTPGAVWGSVVTQDGRASSCAAVLNKRSLSSLDGAFCKTAPNAADVSSLNTAVDSYTQENNEARDQALSQALDNGESILPQDYLKHGIQFFNIDPIYGRYRDLDCKTVLADFRIRHSFSPSFSCETVANRFDYLHFKVTDGNQLSDFYISSLEGNTYSESPRSSRWYSRWYFSKAGDDIRVTPVIFQEEMVEKIPLDLCRCNSETGASLNDEMIMAAPSYGGYIVPALAEGRSSFRGLDPITIIQKTATFETRYVEPSPGQKRPACPRQPNVST